MKLTTFVIGALALLFVAPMGCATRAKDLQDKKMVVMISKDGQTMNQKAGAVTLGPGPGAPMPELRVQATMGQGWFAQLPEPMKENLLEWMFYIMTHKPPAEGMHPVPGAVNPQAAGVPNEMMERVKGAIAERDQKIERLTRALEEAKAQGGNPEEMEKRFRAQMEEKEQIIKKQQERIGEMEKAIQELKAKVEKLQGKPEPNG